MASLNDCAVCYERLEGAPSEEKAVKCEADDVD